MELQYTCREVNDTYPAPVDDRIDKSALKECVFLV